MLNCLVCFGMTEVTVRPLLGCLCLVLLTRCLISLETPLVTFPRTPSIDIHLHTALIYSVTFFHTFPIYPHLFTLSHAQLVNLLFPGHERIHLYLTATP